MSRLFETSSLTVSRLRQEQHSSRFAHGTIWALSIALAAFVIWAANTPVYEVVNGTGQIRPTGLVHRAEHLEGGIAAEIHVEEGDKVEKGALLVSLDTRPLLSELEKARAKEAILQEKTSRARAFLNDNQLALSSQGPSTIAEENFRAAQIKVLQAERATLQTEIASLLERERTLDPEIEILKGRLERLSQLNAQNLVMRDQVENAHRAVLQLETERTELRGERQIRIVQTKQIRAREIEMAARFERETALEIENLSAELIAVSETRQQLEERLEQAYVRSPIDGIVQELGVANPGQILSPGAVVAEIVPAADGFFAEIEVSADRISGVTLGRDASLKVLTHDFTRYGDITATVDRVSPTSVLRENGESVFRVRLSFDETKNGTGRPIGAGMTVAADIRTDERTILEYLLKPVRVIADDAMSEG